MSNASRKARKQRVLKGKRKKREQVSGGCPTPLKTPYRDMVTAISSINRAGHAGKGWGIYECACGWIHVTSIPGPLFRQFDESIYRRDTFEPTVYNSMTYEADKRRMAK